MTPCELRHEVQRLGVDLELSPDGRRFRPSGDLHKFPADLVSALRRERASILMQLHHEAGGDLYDPRLAFVDGPETRLTRTQIRARMEAAFGITHDLAEALIDLAITANYLVPVGDGLYRAVGQTALELANQSATVVV